MVPRYLLWLAVPAEILLRAISNFRVTHLFFALPIEYKLIKFVLLHKDVFFRVKKLLF